MPFPQSHPAGPSASQHTASAGLPTPEFVRVDTRPLLKESPTPAQVQAATREVLGAPAMLPQPASSVAESLFAGVAIAAGVALLAWAAWQGTQRTRRSRRGASVAEAKASLPPPAGRPAPAPDPRAAELLAAAQNIAQQLDARAAQLERTLQTANARIAQLEQSKLVPAPSSGANSVVAPAGRAAASPVVQREPKPQVAAGAPPNAGVFPAHREIFDLADQGLSPVEIAQHLAKPTGQIELILNLRKAARSAT
jgi:hypothetical protein